MTNNELLILAGGILFVLAFGIWITPSLIRENEETKARVAARRREIQEDTRWHGLFRVVRIEHAGGAVSYSIEGWNGFEKGWASPPYGWSPIQGEWCWKFEGFSSAEEAASLIDKRLIEERDNIIASVAVVAPHQAQAPSSA